MRRERVAHRRLKCSLLGVLLTWTTPGWSQPRQTLEHVVAAGDSLWALARHYRISVEALQTANGLGESTRIRTGQKLRIPHSTPPAGKAKRDSKAATLTPRAPAQAGRTKAPRSEETAQQTARERREPQAAPRARTPARGTTKPTPAAREAHPRPVSPAARERAERLFFTEDSSPRISGLDEVAPPWVFTPPSPDYQRRSAFTLDGSHPCSRPDPGFGSYQRWQQIAPMAHVLLPKRVRLTAGGEFNVLFHVHGREPVRKEWVQVMNGAVLVAVDAGIDSESYREAFRDPRTFSRVLQAVERAVARQTGRSDARASRLVVSSWSAGFGALERILAQPFGRRHVLGVILLDGLHAGYEDSSLDRVRLAPFVGFARAADAGERWMYVSHSSVPAVGYASTTETTNYLVYKLGGRPTSVDQRGVDPLQLHRISSFSSGNFHARGFKGGTAADHCAHVALLRDVLQVHVRPLWSEPQQAIAQTGAPGPAVRHARADTGAQPPVAPGGAGH